MFDRPQNIVKQAGNDAVVLLGEHHDQPEHHRWQLHTMTLLYAYNNDMALGFEMFPRSVQPVLDQWVAGELDEETFLKKVEWGKNWNFDAGLYMPLFHFARMNDIPMFAMNVDRELVIKVRENGWDAVPETERQGLTDPVPMDDDYLEFMETIYIQHAPEDKQEALREKSVRDDPNFVRFTQGQLLWDSAMAQSIVDYTKKHKLVVGIMGSGHIVRGFGVPHQLRSVKMTSYTTMVPWHHQFDCKELKPGFADVVVGLDTFKEEEKEPEHPRLGIYMEEQDSGVKILRVVEDSVAEKMGLKAEDLIVQMAGRPVNKASEVADIVKNMVFGTWLPIQVERGDETQEFVAKFPPKQPKD